MAVNPTGIASEKDSLKFPFLGSLENGEPFEYLLLSIDNNIAEIALLQWFLNRTQLHIGDKVDLHFPYHLSNQHKYRNDLMGTVISVNQNEELQGRIYQISLSKLETDSSIQYSSFDQFVEKLLEKSSLVELFIHLIKDSMILKAGIRVYFKHLIPYFSRLGEYSHQEYAKLKTFFLYDMEIHIIDHEIKLENLYNVAKKKITKPEEIPIYIDLELLREMLESEISLAVFNVIFTEKKKIDVQDISLAQPQYGIFMYMNAIKNLEKRLYSNYNHLVIIYLKSIR